jgi:hypothetical protein
LSNHACRFAETRTVKICMKNRKKDSKSRVAVCNKLSLVHLSSVASTVSVCHSCCNTALMSPMAPNFLCQLHSCCWYREITNYDKTVGRQKMYVRRNIEARSRQYFWSEKNKKYYIFSVHMCTCMCVCVRALVALVIQHEKHSIL